MNNREQFANFLSNLFANKTYMQQIAKSTVKIHGSLEKIGASVGRVITFYSTTRSKQVDVNLLWQMLECTEQGFAKLMTKQIGIELQKQNITPSTNNILKVLQHNLTNSFYMHATHKRHLDSILANGFDRNIRPLEQEKQFFSRLFDYEYNYRSNRLYVTNCYNILYDYGVFSPEWLTFAFDNKDVVRFRQKNKAMKLLGKKAQAHIATKEGAEKAKQYVKNVCNYYFTSPQEVVVVLFDRLLKDQYGDRAFNRYNEEEDSFDSSTFTYEFLQKRLQMSANPQKSIFEDEQAFEFAAMSTDKLIGRTTNHEFSTLSKIPPKDFSVALLPSFATFAKCVQKDSDRQM